MRASVAIPFEGGCACGAIRYECVRWRGLRGISRRTAARCNARNLDREIFESIRLRRLDGAETWKFLD